MILAVLAPSSGASALVLGSGLAAVCGEAAVLLSRALYFLWACREAVLTLPRGFGLGLGFSLDALLAIGDIR